jgi:nucleotide-binding universal stress UspA family protein
VVSATAFDSTGEPRRILCAVDLGPNTGHVVGAAAGLARSYSAALILLHAVPKLGESLWDEADAHWNAVVQARARRLLTSLAATNDIAAEILVETGSPAATVAQTVARVRADLAVIGRGATASITDRLRANAYEIIRSSPCPVLSL